MTSPNSIRFDGRVAVVTGAGTGLGRAYALELARRGCGIVVNDLGSTRDGTGASASAADAVVKEIDDLGGKAVANYDSVATPEGGESIVNAAIQKFGRLDILINNAGILRDRSFSRMPPEDWDAVLKVHLYGAFNVSRPAFAAMRQGNYGRIVMASSPAGLFGNFGQANYSAAKMGLVGLMNSLKLEGEKYNIKVNTVAPNALTRMTEDVLPAGIAERMKPESIAPLVIYLCSEHCVETGVIIHQAAGYYSRIAVVASPVTCLDSGAGMPTPEDVAGSWAQILPLEGTKQYHSAAAAGADLIPLAR